MSQIWDIDYDDEPEYNGDEYTETVCDDDEEVTDECESLEELEEEKVD